MARVLASDHGREGYVVGGEQRVVAAVRLSFDGLTLCRRRRGHAEGKPLPVWAMTATSTDAVPFLKVSWGFSPSFYILQVKT
jgi:CheY-like chemotaxis protein